MTFVSAGTFDISASVPGFSADVLDFAAASDSITLTIVRSEQDELSFEFEGIETVVGEGETNPFGGGSGTGDITFSSSDETVDADGVVTTVSAGAAVISAVKAGDDAFLESNIATYDIVVELREKPLLAFESGLFSSSSVKKYLPTPLPAALVQVPSPIRSTMRVSPPSVLMVA